MISQFSENPHQPQIVNFLLRFWLLELDLPGCPGVWPGLHDTQHSPCTRLCGVQSFVVRHGENMATDIFGTYQEHVINWEQGSLNQFGEP
jgi:hypothetical protein